MYRNVQTSVRSPVGMSSRFDTKVGVHQGSALSPLLFNITMNYLTEKIQKPTPWNLLYADDVALISDSIHGIQENLDQWKESLESNGLRISITKTEYMVCNFSPNESSLSSVDVTIDGKALPRVNTFKYLGSVLAEDGSITADITHRTTCGWNKWRTLTTVLCDSKMPIRTKGKVYKTAVRPTYSTTVKYSTLVNDYEFAALAVETLGPWSADMKAFMGALSVRLVDSKGTPGRLGYRDATSLSETKNHFFNGHDIARERKVGSLCLAPTYSRRSPLPPPRDVVAGP
ncbi:uncharacterized protein LOC133516511 [Cydia pomonella]|uniref:uncharacterized protein LOC133516511 n=1 Tax=Cydia pomonella TaxID=82600 RepID=UPI002ADE6796|nr:uncharacterized protein LOC133516511 [Cydia pomonella]